MTTVNSKRESQTTIFILPALHCTPTKLRHPTTGIIIALTLLHSEAAIERSILLMPSPLFLVPVSVSRVDRINWRSIRVLTKRTRNLASRKRRIEEDRKNERSLSLCLSMALSCGADLSPT